MRFMNAAMVCVVAGGLGLASSALAIDEAHQKKAEVMIGKSIDYLIAQQDKERGGWGVPKAGSGQPAYPAITGLIVNGMAMQPKPTDAQKSAIDAGVKYILSNQQPDGGIYDAILPSYNTAISLSALARVDTPQVRDAIKKGQDFLRKTQWGASDVPASKAEPTTPIDEKHPFYGGLGYGNRGRPDISNTQFFLQAMQDTGVPKEDPAVKRAIIFLTRCQMNGATNEMPYAKGSKQGGFIYATAENAQTIGQGQSFAGTIEETMDDGSKVSKLRAYGSVSYAGFKSYIYAGLTPTDARVVAAMDWIKRNYTVEENPGIGQDGRYYFYVSFARALDAAGPATIEIIGKDGKTEKRDWQNDLIDAMEKLQNADGSFKSVAPRWMEDQPLLVTAYSLLALQHATRP